MRSSLIHVGYSVRKALSVSGRRFRFSRFAHDHPSRSRTLRSRSTGRSTPIARQECAVSAAIPNGDAAGRHWHAAATPMALHPRDRWHSPRDDAERRDGSFFAICWPLSPLCRVGGVGSLPVWPVRALITSSDRQPGPYRYAVVADPRPYRVGAAPVPRLLAPTTTHAAVLAAAGCAACPSCAS